MSFKRQEIGCPGHFIAVSNCAFRRHTQVGRYRVSTVGNYFPESDPRNREEVGLGRYFETMVFRTTGEPDSSGEGCGCQPVESWGEIDMAGYRTAGGAQEGHERMVRKYHRIARKESNQ